MMNNFMKKNIIVIISMMLIASSVLISFDYYHQKNLVAMEKELSTVSESGK